MRNKLGVAFSIAGATLIIISIAGFAHLGQTPVSVLSGVSQENGITQHALNKKC